MEYFYKYLLNIIPIFSLEAISFIIGIYYLKKKPIKNRNERLFVYFLGFTVAIELVAFYAPIAYFSNFEYFGFTKGKRYEDNSWLYNIYLITSFVFYIYFFGSLLTNNYKKNILKIINIFFVISTTLNLIFNDVFYERNSVFTIILGSFLLLISIMFYYFELLETNNIIILRKLLPIYISIGVLFFYLCITPTEIFSQFFNLRNELFVNITALIIPLASIIMYSTFITGFIVCAKNKEEN